MKIADTRLVQFLQLLNPQERLQFRRFLESPYHVQQDSPLQLFRILENFYPDFSDKALTPEWVWEQMADGELFILQKLKDQMTQLTRLLKRFLVLEQADRQPENQEEKLLAALADRKAEKLFLQHRKAFLKRLEAQPLRDLAYFEHQFRVARETDQLKGIELKRAYDRALQDKADFLNLSFLIRKLQDYCEMLNRNNLQQQHYQADLLTEIRQILVAHPQYQAVPVIQLWYQILQSLLQPTAGSVFAELLVQLERNGHWVSEGERRAMYKYALNFCIRRINAGDAHYVLQSFQVYQRMLAENLLFVEGQLSHTDYKNVASSGIRLGEFAWVERFIHQYKDQVDSAFAENVYTYCLAQLYAESGKERQAIRLLQEVQFTDVYYALSARTLLLRIFYDQPGQDDLSYQAKAYQHFLQRNNTLSQRNRHLYLQFVRYFKRLVRLREQQQYLDIPKYQKNYRELVGQLAEQKELAHRSWLIERLALLAPLR